MESRTCRLCKSSVAVNRAVSLFSPGSILHKLPTRIEILLEVSVHEKDGLPPYICERCKRQLERLERAAQDLDTFRKLASESYSVLLSRASGEENTVRLPGRGGLKRTKESSGTLGVSPDTVKARPPLKRHLAKRLNFGMNRLAVQCE